MKFSLSIKIFRDLIIVPKYSECMETIIRCSYVEFFFVITRFNRVIQSFTIVLDTPIKSGYDYLEYFQQNGQNLYGKKSITDVFTKHNKLGMIKYTNISKEI